VREEVEVPGYEDEGVEGLREEGDTYVVSCGRWGRGETVNLRRFCAGARCRSGSPSRGGG